MSAMPWIIISIVAGILVVLAVAAIIWKHRRNEYFSKGPDYRAFFWMGLVWVIVGGPVMWLYREFSMSGLFAIGVVFLAMGLANRDKWGKQERLSRQESNRKIIAVIAGILLVLAGIIAFELFYLA